MEVNFITSLFTFYLKGSVKTDKNFMEIVTPNTILKLFPLGKTKKSYPVTQISSVSSEFKLSLKGLIWGIICFILGIGFLNNLLIGLLVLLYSVNVIISSFQTMIHVTVAGNDTKIPIIIFEKSKSDQIENNIKQIINTRHDDTNSKEQTDRIIEAIKNK